MKRIRASVLIDVRYDDDTAFGSMVSGRVERELDRRARPVLATLATMDPRAIPHDAIRDALMRPSCFGSLFSSPDRLRDDFLHPRPEGVRVASLEVHDERGVRGEVEVPRAIASELAPWMAAWHAGEAAPTRGPARDLYDALEQAGAIADEAPRATMDDALATFVGHATVCVSSGRTRVIVDPFFLPPDAATPSYRPLAIDEARADAVLLTHTHPDHYQLGALLRLGPATPIFVPRVARESILAIDLAARLRELGFTDVRVLDWWREATIGDVRVVALPFHGEQPGDGARLHADVRNAGNTYLVEAAGKRLLFTVDAGRDAEGDTRDVAREVRRRFGAVDVVFAGYRSWALFPTQLLGSSVARYALFVPAEDWSRRHRLMNGPEETLDVAEIVGARFVVPYADGGAPWYWSRGLGPRLDVARPTNVHFDPPPEIVRAAAERRSTWGDATIASTARVLVLRPGDSLAIDGDAARVRRHEGHAWPYPEVDASAAPSNEAEMLAVARKKVLLRLLAPIALERFGIDVHAADAQRLIDELRRRTGLATRDRMESWLASSNVTREELAALMLDWARVNALEEHLGAEIERLLPSQLALQSMRDYRARGAA